MNGGMRPEPYHKTEHLLTQLIYYNDIGQPAFDSIQIHFAGGPHV